MTLTQLRYIVAVERHRHFGMAAEKCDVTQPTLSIQIQKLEQDLGVMIFDRTKQPVVPTQDGIAIVAQAKQVLQEAKKLRNEALSLREEVRGDLRIAILPSLAPYLLPLFLSPMAAKYPAINIEILELHNYQLIGRLQQDRADVAITISPISVEGFYEIPVFKEKIAVYVHPDHPLAAKKKLHIGEVDLNEVLLTKDNKNMADSIAFLQGNHYQPNARSNIKYKYGSVETLRKIVEQQGGITLLPHLATYYMGDRRKRYVRYFNDPQPTRQVILLNQRGFQKQRLIDALQQEIVRHLPAGMQG